MNQNEKAAYADSNQQALAETEKIIRAAFENYIKLPGLSNQQALLRLMTRYETIYELCELP